MQINSITVTEHKVNQVNSNIIVTLTHLSAFVRISQIQRRQKPNKKIEIKIISYQLYIIIQCYYIHSCFAEQSHPHLVVQLLLCSSSGVVSVTALATSIVLHWKNVYRDA